ncbi:MAG: L-threonine 3-dehydrogenase [Euryarchaeota archaeon RBG_16_62_10]|nr:MAG: L-threonine 3-dehydrogenase [Euryarchaeota archaeon RBG_16_62_10]
MNPERRFPSPSVAGGRRMYAVVKSKREPGAGVETIPRPEPGRCEVVVEMKMASICGTDVHIWDWNHWAQKRLKHLPIVFGHELCGEVVEVGEGVKCVGAGDIVSAETHIVDGTCYQCRTGRMHICRNMKILGVDTDGVFAEYVKLPEMNARRLPNGLDPKLGSLLEPLGNATFTVLPNDNVDEVKDKNVVVAGAGPIGLMAIAVLKVLGAKQVIATELGSEKVRSALAKKMGADRVLDASMGTEALVREVKELTDGNGADVCLEMSGAAPALKQVFEMLTPGGRVSILGLYNDPVTLDVNNVITFKSATVYGITGRRMFGTWDQMYKILWRKDFREKLSSIVTHTLPIRDIEEGMRLIRTKQAAKVSLNPEW